MAEYLVSKLAAKKACILVDRSSFQTTCAEIALSQSGIIADSAALSAGRIMSARYILTGTIAPAFGKMRISAKIVEVETSALIASASVTLPQGDLSAFAKLAYGEQKNPTSTIFRSLLVPGWGQFYADRPGHGSVALEVCAAGLGGTIATIVAQANEYQDYTKYHNWMWTDAMKAERDALKAATGKSTEEANAVYTTIDDGNYTSYTNKRRTMIIVSSITGALWAINVVDAATAGKKNRKKIDLYFSGIPGVAAEAGLAYRF